MFTCARRLLASHPLPLQGFGRAAPAAARQWAPATMGRRLEALPLHLRAKVWRHVVNSYQKHVSLQSSSIALSMDAHDARPTLPSRRMSLMLLLRLKGSSIQGRKHTSCAAGSVMPGRVPGAGRSVASKGARKGLAAATSAASPSSSHSTCAHPQKRALWVTL